MCSIKPSGFAWSASALAKPLQWLKNHLPTQRRLIQLYAALLHNAHVKGFITGKIYAGQGKMLCMPGLNCYSCPGAAASCPLGALQNAIASSGRSTPFYILGIILLLGLIAGRTICGYLCPMGLLQDLIHKIPTPKVKKSPITRALSLLKYGILLVFVVILPLWHGLHYLPNPAFCKYICPAGTLEGAVGLLSHPANQQLFSVLGGLFVWKMVVLVIILFACVFIYRAFCRFLCPLGALYGLFARIAIIGIKVEPAKCTDCGRCIKTCPMDIKKVGDRECIHCGKCMDVCATKAISFKAGKITLHGPEIDALPPEEKKPIRRNRILAWVLALILLAGVLFLVNQPEKAPVPPSVQTPAPIATPMAPKLPISFPRP